MILKAWWMEGDRKIQEIPASMELPLHRSTGSTLYSFRISNQTLKTKVDQLGPELVGFKTNIERGYWIRGEW